MAISFTDLSNTVPFYTQAINSTAKCSNGYILLKELGSIDKTQIIGLWPYIKKKRKGPEFREALVSYATSQTLKIENKKFTGPEFSSKL